MIRRTRPASQPAVPRISTARSAAPHCCPASIITTSIYIRSPTGLNNQAGQGAGEQLAPRFIANNAIREYASQALVNETLSLAAFADLGRSSALAGKANADLESRAA